MAHIHTNGAVTVVKYHAATAEPSPGGGVPVDANSPGLAAAPGDADCAGEWTVAIGTINDAAYNNTLVIRGNFVDANSAFQKGKQCRPDLSNVDLYSNPVLACAPYLVCP